MPWSLKIQPPVYHEIQAASEYYNQQQSGLGHKFTRAIDNEFDSLKKFP